MDRPLFTITWSSTPPVGHAQQREDVAVKILPESFASEPHRLARFQRETEILASLRSNSHRGCSAQV